MVFVMERWTLRPSGPGAALTRRHCPPDEGGRGSTILIRLKIASNPGARNRIVVV
jgi:hypothetical protein